MLSTTLIVGFLIKYYINSIDQVQLFYLGNLEQMLDYILSLSMLICYLRVLEVLCEDKDMDDTWFDQLEQMRQIATSFEHLYCIMWSFFMEDHMKHLLSNVSKWNED
jgi:hypothetical protein